MKNYFEKEFELGYFQMNKFGEASPTIILALLEEAAAEHCYAINHSLYNLIEQNVGWVLLSGIVEMERYPKYKEKITIRTWLSGYTPIRGIRENIIFDEEGRIIGRARGVWVFFDIERRRPVCIFEDIKEKWSFDPEECLAHDISKKIAAIDTATYIKKFKVNRFDVDMNQHVNNIRYLQWVMESVSDEIMDHYYLHSIDGRFIAEAQYGDTIISLTERDYSDYSFVHTIQDRKDQKICATAKTVWKKRV